MAEFIIFNDNDKFKMKFDLNTTISELKQVISQKLNLSNNYNCFLEKYGFIDINPSLLNSKLIIIFNNRAINKSKKGRIRII